MMQPLLPFHGFMDPVIQEISDRFEVATPIWTLKANGHNSFSTWHVHMQAGNIITKWSQLCGWNILRSYRMRKFEPQPNHG